MSSRLKFWLSELVEADEGEQEEIANKIKQRFPVSEQEIEAILDGRRYNLDLSHIQKGV